MEEPVASSRTVPSRRSESSDTREATSGATSTHASPPAGRRYGRASARLSATSTAQRSSSSGIRLTLRAGAQAAGTPASQRTLPTRTTRPTRFPRRWIAIGTAIAASPSSHSGSANVGMG